MKIEKQSPDTLFDAMNECCVTGNHRNAAIVFDQSNFDTEYSELSRSYITHSDQWGWSYNLLGRRRSAACLDGTDPNVRLDYYDWVIEYWYWTDEKLSDYQK